MIIMTTTNMTTTNHKLHTCTHTVQIRKQVNKCLFDVAGESGVVRLPKHGVCQPFPDESHAASCNFREGESKSCRSNWVKKSDIAILAERGRILYEHQSICLWGGRKSRKSRDEATIKQSWKWKSMQNKQRNVGMWIVDCWEFFFVCFVFVIVLENVLVYGKRVFIYFLFIFL